MDKESAKQEVENIVKRFQAIPQNKLDSMPEEDIKFQFIEPLFQVLGWKREDISKEARILKGRADYILRMGNQESLVIEAKKTNVFLSDDEGRQAVSYAYHRKVKFSVLTNFKYIRVFHALSNIKNIDKNLLFWLEFKDFDKEFDKLWLLSRESFEKGDLNKIIPSKEERKAKPVDISILQDLLEIRDMLSKDLKKLRNYLGDNKIDEAIQILIDRLIFMRSTEDRGLENKNFLLGIVKDFKEGRLRRRLWDVLEEEFKRFDKDYNSKLFAPSILESEKDIFFDDDTIAKVIRILYFGYKDLENSRYMFDEIPGDLLGSVYEQYLGVVLRGTDKRVRLELESGKRKKMGIYYTPSYIVDYIVKNTVGEYIKEKSIDEILEVKIVDPACGSGSFLVRAFQEICNVIEKKLKKGEKSKKYSSFNTYKDRLSLSQKATIMTNCIYGVDLDEKAVELAQLNLLLKILEFEDRNTPNKRLPNLFKNIKNGNSLIDSSTFAGDKAFKWEAQFSEVFKHGGFDIVIGNPPYIRVQEMNAKDVKYLSSVYETAKGYVDTYMLFTEKSINLLKNNGLFSFIMPNKFMSSNYGLEMRKFIVNHTKIKEIIDFGDLPVFETATTYPGIFILEKSTVNSDFKYFKIKDLNDAIRGNFPSHSIITKDSISSSTWVLGESENISIVSKLKNINLNLEGITEKIYQGLITSADDVFILIKKEGKLFSEALEQEVFIEPQILKNIVKGLEIKRYRPLNSKRHLIFPYKLVSGKYKILDEEELSLNFPKTYNYFKQNSNILKSRTDVKNNKIPWHGFSRPQSLEEFEKEKILTPFNAFF